MKHLWWTHHPDRRWGFCRTLDGPGVVLNLGRRAVVFVWGEWS